MILQQQVKKSPAGKPGLATDKGISSANPSYCKYSLSRKYQGGNTRYALFSKPRSGPRPGWDQAQIVVEIRQIPKDDYSRSKLESLFERMITRHAGLYKGDLSRLWLRLQKSVNLDRERMEIATLLREALNG